MTQVHAINFLNVWTKGLVSFFTIVPPNSTIPDDTNQFFSTFPPQVFGEFFLPNLNSRNSFNGCGFFHHLQGFVYVMLS